jgi:phosphoribosylamine--glycine ligase
MRLLVVGRGAREHALVWRLSTSPGVTLYCAPGNAGIAALAEPVPLRESDVEGLVSFARKNRIDLVVVGPEAPLALGLADALEAAGVRVFGPGRAAAEIESSKAFAKELMRGEGIPTASFVRFQEADAALTYLDRLDQEPGLHPLVVKADGLAAGKGVIVCDSPSEARQAVLRMMRTREFGAAGDQVLIEQRLSGEEVSRFDLCDGETALTLPTAQDYKRIFDDDRGPNTGGMGAYAPAPVMDAPLMEEVSQRIVSPVLRALSAAGRPYRGCLYTGLILTESGPQVIEFNCRFGDPEAEVILPLIEGDFAALLMAAAEGRLPGSAGVPPASATPVSPWRSQEQRAVCVVMASPGYPDSYPTGLLIEGLEDAGRVPGVTVFHAGTRREGGQTVTDGGRVLAVTAVGSTFAEAAGRAYQAVDCVHFEGALYRRDIARRVIESHEL